jgi:hypothetical protein
MGQKKHPKFGKNFTKMAKISVLRYLLFNELVKIGRIFRSGHFLYVICWEILRRVGNTVLPRGYAEAEEHQAPGEQNISVPALESLHFRIWSKIGRKILQFVRR